MFRPAVYCYQSCTRVHHGPVAQLVSAPPCHGGGRGFKSRQGRWLFLQPSGAVAQLVERPPEKWKVTSSILVRATTKPQHYCWGFSLVDAPSGKLPPVGRRKAKNYALFDDPVRPDRSDCVGRSAGVAFSDEFGVAFFVGCADTSIGRFNIAVRLSTAC